MQLFEFVDEIESVNDRTDDRDCIGLGAEYLVAADLCLAGYRCSFAAAGLSYDLIADVAGRLLKIQVKATSKQKMVNTGSRSKKRLAYEFQAHRQNGERYTGAADVFAFVALDIRSILYVGTGRQKLWYRIPAKFMTPERSSLSRQVLEGLADAVLR